MHAPPLAQLLQKEPVEGAVPSESTEVRFVYDNRALYVAFRAYDRQPERVYGRLMRRDGRPVGQVLAEIAAREQGLVLDLTPRTLEVRGAPGFWGQ